MNVGLPLRNTNGACGNGSRTALMWRLRRSFALCVFHVSKLNRAIPHFVSIFFI